MSARNLQTKGIGRAVKGLALAALFVLPAFAASTSSGPAPGFQLSGRNGKSIDLSQFKGQVVMINFWDIYKKYKPMGFTLVGVNVEPNTKEAEAFLAKLSKPVTFPVAFDTESKVSKLYNVAVMPSTVFVDRKGNIRVLHRGYKPGEENIYLTQIRSLLKE
jgi:peroxiredoxin